jgi:predicted transcriptional regulator
MSEQLEQDMESEGLLDCVHGPNRLDRAVFEALVNSDGAVTVDEGAERVDQERSTVYRAVQRLLTAGFLQKDQVTYDHGGDYHVDTPADPSKIADEMQRLVNWEEKSGQLIRQFETKY